MYKFQELLSTSNKRDIFLLYDNLTIVLEEYNSTI